MRNIIGILFLFVSLLTTQAQELNCTVTLGHQKINTSNTQIFTTLERSLNDFMNNTRWSDQVFNQNEKVDCAMFINITGLNGSTFTASVQIQSSRPVYGSGYTTPVLNYSDKDFTFDYVEFESLNYDPNSFNSNLTSVLAFYANIILGLDADSFKLEGGTTFYETANSIVAVAQSSSRYKGWSQQEGGNQNRYFLANDLSSNAYASFRKALYEYHIQGMDKMADNLKAGKEGVKNAIKTLVGVHRSRPNALLTRLFFDAKSDELVSIFNGGPQVTIADLVDNLNNISPLNTSKWSNMRM